MPPPPSRQCATCGRPFQPERSTALYCGDTCRKRAQRGILPARHETQPAPSPLGLPADLVAVLVALGDYLGLHPEDALRLLLRRVAPARTGEAAERLVLAVRALAPPPPHPIPESGTEEALT